MKPDGLPEPQVTKVELATSRERFTLPKKLICMNASGSYTAETHQVCFPLIMTHSLYSKARLKSAFLPKNALNAFFLAWGGEGVVLFKMILKKRNGDLIENLAPRLGDHSKGMVIESAKKYM